MHVQAHDELNLSSGECFIDGLDVSVLINSIVERKTGTVNRHVI